MTPHLVHLNCPQCAKELHIDAGFRGAVARCDRCHALISVPRKGSAASVAEAGPARRPRQPGALGEAQPPKKAPGRRGLLITLALTAIGIACAVGAYLSLNP